MIPGPREPRLTTLVTATRVPETAVRKIGGVGKPTLQCVADRTPARLSNFRTASRGATIAEIRAADTGKQDTFRFSVPLPAFCEVGTEIQIRTPG